MRLGEEIQIKVKNLYESVRKRKTWSTAGIDGV